jgi:hypothetical protein
MYKYFSCFFCFEKRVSSKYIGVYWNKASKKWYASVRRNYIGSFEIEEDAAKAVNSKCQEFNIPLKNSSVGVLDNEALKKLTSKVIKFYS